MEKERNSSLELLRIICMILIIAHHYGYYGGYANITYNSLSVSRIFVQILTLFGRVPCQIFALITGYFLINSKKNNYYRKMLKIFFTLLFYSVSVLGITYFFDILPIKIHDIIKSLFPIVFDNWYVVGYLVLLLFVPYINSFILSLDEKTFRKINIMIIIVWALIPTIVNGFQFVSTPWFYGNLDFFIAMYFMGAYLRLYYKKKWNNIYNLFLSLFMIIIMIILTVCLDYFSFINQTDAGFEKAVILGQTDSIIVFVISIFMFVFFMNLKFKNKFINSVASTTLGIYILHENYFMRIYIWRTILPNIYYLSFPYFHFIGKTLVIFIVCGIIEYLRKKIVADRLDDLIIDKIFSVFKKTRK